LESDLERGVIAHKSGDPHGATYWYHRVLERDSQNAAAIHFLGMLAHEAGRGDEAISSIEQSIRLSPASAGFRVNLAKVRGQRGEPLKAIACLREAIQIDPTLQDAHINLGLLLEGLGRFDEALAAYRTAMRIADCGDIRAHEARVEARMGCPPRSTVVDRATPSAAWIQTLKTLEYAYERVGLSEEALATQRKLVALRPDLPAAHSALLFLELHQPNLSPGQLFDDHCEWARRHSRFMERFEYRKSAPAGRKIHVGYLSPDFKRHPVSRLTAPLLDRHDRGQFSVYCYSDVKKPDEVTANIRSLADHWRDTSSLTDELLFQLIRSDEIDILVDLAGHTNGNRLPLFARRAAPVQVTYIYPHSTGLASIDARITDVWCDPVGYAEKYHVEKVVRIAETAWAYRPPEVLPPVSALPSLKAGHITFGSVNRLLKVTREVIIAWAKLMRAVTKSRLLIMAETE
jgi:protein O-GlcNAc transferase